MMYFFVFQELQLLNEKHILERKISDLRMVCSFVCSSTKLIILS